MKWDVRYKVSRSLVIQVGEDGKLVGTCSVSRKPLEMPPHIFFVLNCFLAPITLSDGLKHLEDEWDVEREEFEDAVKLLLEFNILTPDTSESEEVSAAQDGFATVGSQHLMLCDTYRVLAYRGAIARHVAGLNVVEIGCGTGVLSLFAAQAGAATVTAIEESKIAELAREMFQANGFGEKISLRVANSRDVALDEPVDVIIHELIGTDPLAENMLPIIADARRRLLKPGGRLIPNRIEIAGVGFQVSGKGEAMREAEEFERIYGLSFAPFKKRLIAEKPERIPPSPLHFNRGSQTTIITSDAPIFDFDLYQDLDALPERQVFQLTALKDGYLGGVQIFFRAHLDEQTLLTNSPFTHMTHWGRMSRYLEKSIAVKSGETIALAAVLKTVNGKQVVTVEPEPNKTNVSAD